MQRYLRAGVRAQVESALPAFTTEVKPAKSGAPVPIVNGIQMYSLEDPIEESRAAIQSLGETVQRRLIICGFGFGYHILPFIEAGLSPIVFEPDPAMVKLAACHVDLGNILPFITLHVGEDLPDIPRSTDVVTLPLTAQLFPEAAQALHDKVIKVNPNQADTIDHGVFYTSYRNVMCMKNPCDLAVFQMLFALVRPTLVIEIGTGRGGSALYFADLLRMYGGAQVHTYDIEDDAAPEVKEDPQIVCHLGGFEAFNPEIVGKNDRVLAIEDAVHSYECTRDVIKKLHPYITKNSYLILEDGKIGQMRPDLNGGPIRAVEEFLSVNTQFELDTRWETFYGSPNTSCLKGFLRRK